MINHRYNPAWYCVCVYVGACTPPLPKVDYCSYGDHVQYTVKKC
jgi:hypothetical protein